MINRTDPLPVSRQAAVLGISRGTVYYRPRPVSEEELALMRCLDELHLDYPFAGARMLRDLLCRAGWEVGRKRVSSLMKRMGIEALYRRPKTTHRTAGHQVYPYLLRDLDIICPNQVWAMDITYIPMARGFMFLTVVMDWFSRRVLCWKLSSTLDAQFCLDAVNEAVACYGKPEIINTDQGSQYTGSAFTALVKGHGIRQSMDGKGAWRDNVMVERLWRSVKYEEVYLHAYETVSAARAGLSRYWNFYNSRRPHSQFGRQTPDEVYFNVLSFPETA